LRAERLHVKSIGLPEVSAKSSTPRFLCVFFTRWPACWAYACSGSLSLDLCIFSCVALYFYTWWWQIKFSLSLLSCTFCGPRCTGIWHRHELRVMSFGPIKTNQSIVTSYTEPSATVESYKSSHYSTLSGPPSMPVLIAQLKARASRNLNAVDHDSLA